MERKLPRQFLRGLMGGELVLSEVVDWAGKLRKDVGIEMLPPLVGDLISANPRTHAGCNQIVSLLSKLAEEWHPDFRESVAKEVLSEACRNLLTRQISPLEFCRLVNHFDAQLVDKDYPAWLAKLWNACDWVDERSLDEVPALADEAQKVLSELDLETGS